MKIPEELRSPALVFSLQAALLGAIALIFFLMLPQGH
jgi:hypothetical protein